MKDVRGLAVVVFVLVIVTVSFLGWVLMGVVA